LGSHAASASRAEAAFGSRGKGRLEDLRGGDCCGVDEWADVADDLRHQGLKPGDEGSDQGYRDNAGDEQCLDCGLPGVLTVEPAASG
jgi:hypothetical protein